MKNEDVLLRIDADIKQATAAIDRLKTGFKGFGKDVETETKQLKQRLDGIMRSVAVGFAAASTAIGVGLGKSIQNAAHFEQAMRNVNSIAKDSESTFARITESVLRMGSVADLAEGPSSLASALYDINSAGFKSEAGLKVLETSSKAATAGLTETSTAAKGIVVALNSYGKGANEAGRLADILFQTVEEGIITFPTLSDNIGKVTAVASAGGVSMEELGAAMAQLTAKGLSAEEAAVALRGAILKMLAPTEAQKKAAAEYGITLGEAALKQQGFAGLLADINTKTRGSKEALFDVIGEVRAFNGALKLIGDDGGASFINRIERFENSSGALGRALAQQEKALSTQFKKLAAAVETSAVRVGEAFIPATKALVENLKDIFQAFNNLTGTQQKTIAWSVAASGAIAAVTAGLITLKGSADAASIAMGKLGYANLAAGLSRVSGAIGAIGTTIAGLGAATLATFAGVIGSVAIDFGGLRSTVVDVFTDVGDIIGEAVDSLRDDLAPAFDAISVTVGAIVYGLGLFQESVLGIGLAFVRAGIPATLRLIIDSIVLATETLWDFGKLLVAVAERDVEKIKAAWNEFGTDFRDNIYRLESDNERLWSDFTKAVGENLDRAETRFSGLRSFVTKEVEETSKKGEEISGAFASVTDTILSESKSMVSSLNSAWTSIRNQGVSAFDDIRSSFGRLVDDLSNSNNFGAYFDLLKEARNGAKRGPVTVSSLSDVPSFLYDQLTGGQREDNGEGGADKATKEAEKLELQRIKNKALLEKLSIEKVRDLEIAAIKAHTNDELKILKIQENYLKDKDRREREAQKAEEKVVKDRNSAIEDIYKRAFVHGGVNLSNLSDKTIGDTLRAAELAAKTGYTLGVTSGARFDNPVSDHFGEGSDARAIDLYIKELPSDPKLQANILDPIAAAAGFQGRINEFDPAVLAQIKHSQGNHYHAISEGGQRDGGLDALGRPLIKNFETSAKITDQFRQQSELLKDQSDILSSLRFYEETGLESPEKAAEAVGSFFKDFEDIGAQFTDSEFFNILDNAFEAPKAQLVELSALFDEQLQKDLERIGLRRDAGVLADEEALIATRDRIAEELNLETLKEEDKLAAMARIRQAELAIRDARLADAQAEYEEGLRTDQEYEQRRLAILNKTKANLSSLGIVATGTQKMIQEVASASNKFISDQAKEVASSMENAFLNFAKDTLQGQADFSKAFRSLWGNIANSVINSLIQMITKTKAYIAVMTALKALMNSIFGFFSGGASLIVSGPTLAHTGGLVPEMHSGGLVGRSIQPLPDELLTMLQSGEAVLDASTTSDLLNGRSAIFNRQGRNGYHVENQNFYGADPYEFSQIMGRELDYELAYRKGF